MRNHALPTYMTLHQATMLPLLIFCLCHSMGDSSKVEKVIPSIKDSSQFDPWGIKSLYEEGVERF